MSRTDTCLAGSINASNNLAYCARVDTISSFSVTDLLPVISAIVFTLLRVAIHFNEPISEHR
jgi:hypothetical protein